MLNECLSDKGTAKLYIQFRLKKTDLNISTRSISEILKPFKKFAVMFNLIRTWKYTHAGVLNNT